MGKRFESWKSTQRNRKLYPAVDDVDLALYCGHGLKKGRYDLTNNSLHFYTSNSSTNFHSTGVVGERSDKSNLLTTEAPCI